jgi:hypothetical protein
VLDRQGSRFALEVLFLAALATGLALAKLHALVIVGAMAFGWIVVALLEWAAWRGEPHYGFGLPPRYYLPRTSLPPAQPLEQVYSGYPNPQREEAPTWIASADLRARLLGEWPVTGPADSADDDEDGGDVEPVRLPRAAEVSDDTAAPAVAAAPPPPPAPLPPLPAVGRRYGSATHQLEPFAPPPGRKLLRREKVEVFVVDVPARAVPLLLPGRIPR